MGCPQIYRPANMALALVYSLNLAAIETSTHRIPIFQNGGHVCSERLSEIEKAIETTIVLSWVGTGGASPEQKKIVTELHVLGRSKILSVRDSHFPYGHCR